MALKNIRGFNSVAFLATGGSVELVTLVDPLTVDVDRKGQVYHRFKKVSLKLTVDLALILRTAHTAAEVPNRGGPRPRINPSLLRGVLQVDLDAGVVVAVGTVEGDLKFADDLLVDNFLLTFPLAHGFLVRVN